MAKNLILGTILPRSAQIWAPKIFFLNFTSTSSYKSYAICRKANEQNFAKKWQKPNFGPSYSLFDPHMGPQNIFREFYLY